MLKKNSQRHKEQMARNFSDVNKGVIFTEEQKKAEALRKKAQRERNAEALKYFEERLKENLPQEAIEKIQCVFQRWAAIGYRREATLAHYDVERVVPEHQKIIDRSVVQLMVFLKR